MPNRQLDFLSNWSFWNGPPLNTALEKQRTCCAATAIPPSNCSSSLTKSREWKAGLSKRCWRYAFTRACTSVDKSGGIKSAWAVSARLLKDQLSVWCKPFWCVDFIALKHSFRNYNGVAPLCSNRTVVGVGDEDCSSLDTSRGENPRVIPVQRIPKIDDNIITLVQPYPKR